MKKFLVIFILFGITYCLAKVTWSYNINHEQCEAFVQVNEDNSVIFLETMPIPGTFMTTHCWETSATACHVKQDEVSYINGMKMNGTTTFLNNENQICYFENIGLNVDNMGGFYEQPWSYVYGLNINVSCEDSSSIPQYCAKSEKMAKQVLLAKEEMECEEKGGKFEGGVYPFKMPNDTIEYCVTGRCDICNSKWYKKFVEHWKDSVCCESRRKEPNTNNGTCISPPSFNSSKIGVKHSKITAFPGCSKVKAGKNNNFCFRSSSSTTNSSSSENSSFSTASSSSNGSSTWNSSSSSVSFSSNELSSSEYSSSSEDSSSSSEEQEDGSCYPNSSDAQAALSSAEAECWSMQKESRFKLDSYGCLTGECYGELYSSDDGYSESSSSEAGNSSDEEERCNDINLMKKASDDEEDPWIYVGKEKYTSKTITYEEPVASSGIFDALGRMYTMVKSKIKYYMGLDSKVTKTVEVGEELDVWKENKILNEEKIVLYRKFNRDSTIEIDSILFRKSQYEVIEVNLQEKYYKHIDTSGIVFFVQYEENHQIKELFFIGLNHEKIYDKDGLLEPHFKKVNNDTVFFDVEYLNYPSIPDKKRLSLQKQSNNLVYAKEIYSCSIFKIKEDPMMPTAKCMRFEHKDIGNEIEGMKTGEIFFPGLKTSPTFGKSNAKFNHEGFSCDYDCDKNGIKRYYHSPTNLLIDELIIVMVSNWKKDSITKEWKEQCWKNEDMQATYNHEVQHIRNARKKLEQLFYHYMVTSEESDIRKFLNEKACNTSGESQMEKIYGDFLWWNAFEVGHLNGGQQIGEFYIPPSPKPSPEDRKEGTCPTK